MKEKGVYIILIISLMFILFGFYYSPSYFLKNFGNPPRHYLTIVYIIDIALIAIGLLLFFLRNKIYEYRKEIILLTVSLIFTVGLLEVGFRTYLATRTPDIQQVYMDADKISYQQKYSRHHYLGYYPTPNFISFDGKNKHNSLGYRGEEIAVPKPYGTFRVITLGGSTTYGEGVKDYKATYPYILQKELREIYNHTNIEVVNAGVGGYDSWESLINFEFRTLDLDPDLIIVYHGANDVHSRIVNPKYYRGDNSGRRKPWEYPKYPFFFRSVFIRLILERLTGISLVTPIGVYVTAKTAAPYTIIESVNEKINATPLKALMQNEPKYFERNLRNIITIAKKYNITVLLSTYAWNPTFETDYVAISHYEKGLEQNNEVVRKLSESENVPLYDFKKEMPVDKKYWKEGRHLNENGNFLKGQLFAKFIHNNNLIPNGTK